MLSGQLLRLMLIFMPTWKLFYLRMDHGRKTYGV